VSRPELSSNDEITSWLQHHPHWLLSNDHLVGRFEILFDLSVKVLVETERTISRLNHHPTVTLEYGRLGVELWTHDRGGVTPLDFDVAQSFDDAVAALL
jgi:4a-hydroxytetrahydrobiopterin dehydratase